MRTLLVIAISVFAGLMTSCDPEEESTQQQDLASLNELLLEIELLASSKDCSDAAEWDFTGFGNKACGGYTGFIAYPKDIDTELLFRKIEEHIEAQTIYNQKWGTASDCAITVEPTGVICEEGKAVLTY